MSVSANLLGQKIRCLSVASENTPLFFSTLHVFYVLSPSHTTTTTTLQHVSTPSLHYSICWSGSSTAVHLEKACGSGEKVDHEWFRLVAQMTSTKSNTPAWTAGSNSCLLTPMLASCCMCMHQPLCVPLCWVHSAFTVIVTDLINFQADCWDPDSP